LKVVAAAPSPVFRYSVPVPQTVQQVGYPWTYHLESPVVYAGHPGLVVPGSFAGVVPVEEAQDVDTEAPATDADSPKSDEDSVSVESA
jgi:hypothetical protein